MGWLIFLGVVFLLAILPLGARAAYDSGGFRAWVLVGPVRIAVFPQKKEKKPKEKEQPKAEKTPEEKAEENLAKPPKPPAKEESKEEKGGSLTDFLPFVRLGLDALGDLRRKLRVNNLYVRLVLASSDPADLGIQYGRAWEALGNLMPRLERVLRIQKRDIQLGCDFEAEQTLVIFRMDLTITLGRALALVVRYGIRGLKEYLNFKKKRKGGAKK